MASHSLRPRAFPPARRAVSLAFLVNGFVLGSWTPQAPFVAERLGIGEARLGLVILGVGLGALVAMPAIGGRMARSGSRRPTLGTQAALALAFPLLMIAPTMPLAMIAAIVFGAAMGGMDAAMNANAVATEKHLVAAIMSSCHGFWSLGGFLGAFGGGPVIAATSPALHGALVGLTVAAMLAFVARSLHADDPSGESAPVEAGSARGAAAGGPIARLRARLAALRQPRVRVPVLTASAIGLFTLLCFSPEGVAIDWSAIFLKQDLGASTAVSGVAFAAFSAMMATCRFLGDGIRMRFGAVRVVTASLLIATLGLTTVGLSGSLPVAVAGFAVMGCGLANLVPVAFSAAGNVAGLKPEIGIAIATSFGYSGALITPSAIGWAAEHFGFAAVFLTLAALLLGLIAMAPLMRGADGATTDTPASERPDEQAAAAGEA